MAHTVRQKKGKVNVRLIRLKPYRKELLTLKFFFTLLTDCLILSALFLTGLASVTERREQLACKFFDSVEEPRSCFHHLLLHPRDSVLLSHIRDPAKYPRISNRTKKYQSFISCTLLASIRPR